MLAAVAARLFLTAQRFQDKVWAEQAAVEMVVL
jgi:hypothetical protein